MATLKGETQQLREATGELSAQAWESQSSLTELQPCLKDLEERVNLLRSWAEETARASEVLVGLEPVLIYLAGGERPSRVSRHLAGRMADVREWHQAGACDVGVLIERLRDLGDEMRAGLATPAQSDSL
jgi:hypothetical protein